MAQRTTRITVETDTFLVVRGAKATLAHCPDCAAEVDVLTLASSDGQPAKPESWMSAGKLHLWYTTEGAIQICVNSLLRCFAGERARPSRST